MDPNQTLKDLHACLNEVNTRSAASACSSLYRWIKRGGFEPNWHNYPMAASAYRLWAWVAHPAKFTDTVKGD